MLDENLRYKGAVNHVAPYTLARKLTGLLEKNKPSRIIFVSSICYDWHPLDWNDMESRKDYEKYVQYSRSKLMVHMTAFKMARLLEGSGVTCNVLEPGVIETKLLRSGGYHGAPVTAGTRASVFLAQSDKANNINGGYFDNKAKQVRQLSADSTDVKQQERLWEYTEKLCERYGIVFP
ncbi:Retinol dehydrogenase 14 [Toxocara canis]|uniref:Retinol dehydrogenase 14 n=1 Tax=Toxocara canis TaxID=6265 RepID=A0A0B2VA65_TOXCA|nr:Retinol dehydrogenase 14 [Toxocara canis]